MSSKGYPRTPPHPTPGPPEERSSLSLKGSVSASRGHLTRLYGELNG